MSSGDDIFTGTNADDTFDGGAGFDITSLADSSTGYRIDWVDGKISLVDLDAGNGDTGTDTLTGMEVLRFAGTDYAISYQLTADLNGETLVTSANASQHVPNVTGLSDGGYIVVWTTSNRNYSQRYDSDGDKVGAVQLVNPTNGNGAYITELAGGGYVVSWTGTDAHGSGVFSRMFDSNGDALGASMKANTTTTNEQVGGSVAALADGGYVIVWSSDSGIDTDVFAQRYSSSGVKVGGETMINSVTAGYQSTVKVTGLASGGYVATWTSAGDIKAQLYDSNGVAVGGEQLVNTTTQSFQWGATVEELGNGGFVISWLTDPAGIASQRYDSSGAKVGGETIVTTAGTRELTSASLADGGYVIAWELNNNVYVQRYDVDGDAVGGTVRANATGGRPMGSIEVAGLGDGGFIVTWNSYDDTEFEDADIFTQRFDANGVPAGDSALRITGTSSADVIIGGLGGQSISGMEGNDTLNGGDGNDNLVGGADNDTLAGGDDNDTLNGGTGVDVLNGGTGNDTYILADADTINEANGGGTDTVMSALTYTLGNNVENLTLTGTANINATGNTLNNILIGNRGKNILNGGSGGVDTLYGGDGDDIYVVSPADIIHELDDNGMDLVQAGGSYTLVAHVEDLTLTGTGNSNGTGTASGNIIRGNSGNNIIDGKGGYDALYGGEGNDILYIYKDGDQFVGGNGNDTYIMIGPEGNFGPWIRESATGGIDTIKVSYTLSFLDDNVENLVLMGSNNLVATGNNGNNVITGNSGENRLYGYDGNDTLIGGLAIDQLSGGNGADKFRFNVAVVSGDVDTITDFSVSGGDVIQLENAIYKKFTATGAMNAANFRASAAGTAADSNDYILYDTDAGLLYYDADGSGAGARLLIAFMGTSTHPALSAADFAII